ncbi:MAG: hypothetical protein Cons2KO_29190 [Congregibacter sp.]
MSTNIQRRTFTALAQRSRPFALLAAICLGALYVSAAQAGEQIRVLDRSGSPLPGAVLRLDFARETAEISPTANGNATSKEPVVIDQRGKRFEPFVTVVTPGALVSFPNSDDIRHHVYSFSESKQFELKLYEANDAEPVQFDVPGIVALGCNIHDNMQAYLIVSERPYLGISDKEGVLSFNEPTPPHMQIWHPFLRGEAIRVERDALRKDAAGTLIIDLPVDWKDPQAVRSASQLESLLKQFSRDAS